MTDTEEDRRLDELRATCLLDSAPEAAFDRLTRMAAQILAAPTALVSLVDDRRQFFKSTYGLGEPWATLRETPLTHSFCQFVVRARAPLVVPDAREHPLLRDNLAIRDLGVVAYAGVPLSSNKVPVGALCVLDTKVRVWSAEDVALLSDLAASVMSEIELRALARREALDRDLTNALFDNLADGVLAIDSTGRFLVANAAARRMFAAPQIGQRLPEDWASLHRARLPDGSVLPSESGALRRALRGERTDSLEFSLQPPGAREAIWAEANGRPIFDGAGNVTGAIAVYRDITARKHQIDMYRALAENVPNAMVILFDHDLRCIAMDGGLVTTTGTDRVASVGRTMRELAALRGIEDDFEPVEHAYRRALAGVSSQLDFMLGNILLELRTAPVRDELGEVIAGVVLAIDVTAHRRMEALARQSEAQFRAFVENIPLAIHMHRDHVITYVNPALLRLLGYEDGRALVDKPVLEALAHEAGQAAIEARLRLPTLDRPNPARSMLRHRDGSAVWVETYGREYELAGTKLVVAVHRDLTNELRAERVRAQLVNTLETFRLMVEAVRDYAIFQVDARGSVVSWNEGARAIKGYEANEIIGLPLHVFYPAERRLDCARLLEVAAAHGRGVDEGWRVRKDGTRFWARGVLTAIRGPRGEVEGFVKVTCDETFSREQEQRMVAKQEELMAGLKEREVLLQEVHHRVKNNLQVVSSMINMQVRSLEPGAAREALEECNTRVLAIAMIHEQLYRARNYADVNFASYTRTLCATVVQAMAIDRHRVALELDIPDIPMSIERAIPCGLVLNELISNALKHGFPDQTAGTIRVGLRRVDDGKLELEVADTGVGLPPDFDLQRARSVGAQLIITLAEQLRGTVQVIRDNGTKFIVTFPEAPSR